MFSEPNVVTFENSCGERAIGCYEAPSRRPPGRRRTPPLGSAADRRSVSSVRFRVMRRLPRSCVVQAGWWQREPGGGEQAGTLGASSAANALRGAEAVPRDVGSDGAARAVMCRHISLCVDTRPRRKAGA